MHTAYSIQFLYKNTGHLPIKIAILDHRTSLGASAVLSCDLPCSGCQLLRLPSPDIPPTAIDTQRITRSEKIRCLSEISCAIIPGHIGWYCIQRGQSERKRMLWSCQAVRDNIRHIQVLTIVAWNIPRTDFTLDLDSSFQTSKTTPHDSSQAPSFQPVFGSKTPQKIAFLPPKTLRLVPRHPHVKDLMSMVQAESPGVASGSNVSHPTVKRIQPLKLPGRCDRLLCWPYQVESRDNCCNKKSFPLALIRKRKGETC